MQSLREKACGGREDDGVRKVCGTRIEFTVLLHKGSDGGHHQNEKVAFAPTKSKYKFLIESQFTRLAAYNVVMKW